MTDYLQYWRPTYVVVGNRLEHTTSDRFGKVRSGDVIWVVSTKKAALVLLGPIVADKVVGQREAERLFRYKPWRARYHVIARRGAAVRPAEIKIGRIARKLRFIGRVERLPTRSRDWPMSLQSIRTLTPESAQLLWDFWKAKHREHSRLERDAGEVAAPQSVATEPRRRMQERAILSTSQLAAALAGGVDYIRTKGNEVKGLALRLDLNRQAPEVVVVGKGPRIERRARLFLDSQAVVPAYVKRKANEWEYIGKYRATAYRTDRTTIDKYRQKRPAQRVAGILFLEAVDKAYVEVRGGGFADPQTRREIEVAAVEFATRWLKKEGYSVADRQRENCGYDLLAVSPAQTLKVEVKGTDATAPRFFISRNERTSSADGEWRLALVTSARTNPSLDLFSGPEAEDRFVFEPLAWECKLRDS